MQSVNWNPFSVISSRRRIFILCFSAASSIFARFYQYTCFCQPNGRVLSSYCLQSHLTVHNRLHSWLAFPDAVWNILQPGCGCSADISERLMVQSLQNRNKFITTITTCKKFFRYRLTELDCKRANILIPFVMSQIVVWSFADCSDQTHTLPPAHSPVSAPSHSGSPHTYFCLEGLSPHPDRLFSANLILCSKTYHLYQFRSNDQYQSQNINQYDFSRWSSPVAFFCE